MSLLTRREKAERRIEAHIAIEVAHPGWIATVRTPEFVRWLDAQPPEVYALSKSQDPTDAIALLDRYEESRR